MIFLIDSDKDVVYYALVFLRKAGYFFGKKNNYLYNPLLACISGHS